MSLLVQNQLLLSPGPANDSSWTVPLYKVVNGRLCGKKINLVLVLVG